MLRLVVWGVCVCLALLNVTAQAVVQPITSTNTAKTKLHIQTWHLANGTTVFYTPLAGLPMVDVKLIVDAGSARDGKLPGIASLTNHNLGIATTKHSAEQLAQALTKSGAKFNQTVERDMSILSLRSLTIPEYLNPSTALFAEIISQPDFSDKSYTRVKNKTLQIIKGQRGDTEALANLAFYKQLYGHTPYGHNPMGTQDSLHKITLQQVKQFYHRYYVGHNAILVIVGNVSRAQAEVIANETGGLLASGKAPEAISSQQPSSKAAAVTINYPSDQTSIRIGQIGIRENSADYFPLLVGNYILGGGAATSRLYRAIREQRGLSYFIYSKYFALKQPGPFVIGLQTRPEKVRESIDIINQVTNNFVEKGPTPKEVALAKQHLIGHFPLQLDSNASIADKIALMAFYHLPLNYLETYQANIDAVTTSEMKAILQKHLHPEQFTSVAVGPSTIKS